MSDAECKIITMPVQSYDYDIVLSDDDIFNLFMGAVNLIKKHATRAQVERLFERLNMPSTQIKPR